MKGKIIFNIFMCSLLLTYSCHKETVECYCGVTHPEIDLAWLKEILNRRFCTLVYHFKSAGKEYISITDCGPVDAMAIFYSCDGEKVCEIGGLFNLNTCEEGFLDDFPSTGKLIYKQDK